MSDINSKANRDVQTDSHLAKPGDNHQGKHSLNDDTWHDTQAAQKILNPNGKSMASTDSAQLNNPRTNDLYSDQITVGDKQVGLSGDSKVSRQRDDLNAKAEQSFFGPYEQVCRQKFEQEGLSAKDAQAKAHELAQQGLDKFHQDQAKLEERSKKMKENFLAEGVDSNVADRLVSAELVKTYHQISRLFTAPDNPEIPGITVRERVMLAKQIMHQAAEPFSICQGIHNTCGPAAVVEARTYFREPSEAAALVVDIALTKHHRTPAGKTVSVDSGSIAPHDEARQDPPSDTGRGLASQIFTVTAVNYYYQKHHMQIAYQQVERAEGGDPNKPNYDTGERLYDTSKNPPAEISREPGIASEQQPLVEIGNDLTNRRDYEVVLCDGVYADNGYRQIKTEAEIQAHIADRAKEGKLPLTVGLLSPAGHEHVVNVVDYYPGPPAMVDIQNTAGASVVRVSAHDLYQSMLPPK